MMKFEPDGVVELRTFPCTTAGARGFTIIAGVMDESAHFVSSEGSSLDAEVETAMRRGTGTTRGPVIKCSTPLLRSGIL